jgi:hypothetical protein
MMAFCEQYTPEISAEAVVQSWLSRLYSNDNNLYILVTLDNTYKITGHMVIDALQQYGHTVIYCYQAQSDKNNDGTVAEGLEFMDKLMAERQASCCIFSTAKSTSAFSKKYGYKALRTVMIKCAEDDSSDSL